MDASPILLQIGRPSDGIWDLLNSAFISAFVSSLFGALAGAFAGAIGANYIAERSKDKEYLLSEIRNINVAISATSTILNVFITSKDQHVKNLCEKYKKQHEEYDKLRKLSRSQLGSNTYEYTIHTDFQTLMPIKTHADFLNTLIFEKVDITGRPLAMVTALSQTVKTFNDFVVERNNLIDEFRNKNLPPKELTMIYFGLDDGNGKIDQRYSTVMTGIYEHCDDCIYFSYVLSKDLIDRGNQIRSLFKKRHHKSAPKIGSVNFSYLDQSGLLPNADNYSTWHQNSF